MPSKSVRGAKFAPLPPRSWNRPGATGVVLHTTLEDPMTRRHLAPAALLVAAALALPSAAQAKQVTGLTVCGADGCARVDRAIGRAMHDIGGPAIATAPRPGPYFRLVLHIGDGTRTFGTSRVVYLPASRAIGYDGGWSRLSRGAAAKLRRVLDGREPLPATQLARSTRDPATNESRPAEVVLPPKAARTTTKAASGGGDLLWWSLGGVAAVAALAFIGHARVLRLDGS
jgi:hypothetical protein